MRAGVGMVRSGLRMRQELKRKAVSDRISSVRMRTRGALGAKNPKLFSKYTVAGQKRRDAAAKRMKAIRAGFPSHSARTDAQKRSVAAMYQAEQARRSARHAKMRSITRIGFQKAGDDKALSKKLQYGKMNRTLLADALRKARKGPHSSPMFGYSKGASRTVDLRRG